MENNKFFNIKGLAHGSKRLLLLKAIMWIGLIGGFGPKLIRFNGLFSFSTLVIIIPLIVIDGLSLYTSYKDYVVFNEKGIILDYIFFNSGNRDRLYSILKSTNGLN